ncbi:MAG: Na+/H+ antiporter subunit C [Terrimicrobiaceae bacterium]
MEFLLAITIGVLYAAAAYLLLRRSVVKLILGIAVLSQAVNLLIFTAAGLSRGMVAFVPGGATALPPESADPLPQALILTAIVISFGVLAFTLVLVQRADKTVGSDDLDDLKSTDA